jgi:endonuclease YncB( thermonuclease family)
MKLYLRLLLSLVLVCAGCVDEQPDDRDFHGVVHKIFDGDSFIVRTGLGSEVEVRVQDIDAPERRQPHADVSRAALERMIGGKRVSVDVTEIDQYGRKIARVYRDSDQTEVGRFMVEQGHAWVYRRTVRDEQLIELEERARKDGRGLWALPEKQRMPPWQYRYLQRQRRQ